MSRASQRSSRSGHGCRSIRAGRSFFFSSRRRHTSSLRDWSSDVCSSDLAVPRRWPRIRTWWRDPAPSPRKRRRWSNLDRLATAAGPDEVLKILAGDHRQLAWNLAGGEPADGGALLGLPDDRLARSNATDESGRHPVLALVREDVVHDVEQLTDLDLDAVLLAYLTPQRIREPLTKLH